MSNRRLDWMAKDFRDNGLTVKGVAGWKDKGGESFKPRGVMFHHTANPNPGPRPSLDVVVNGRKGLAGPLCNVLVGRDCVVYLIAAGRANHAGKGGPWPLAGGPGSIPVDSGNLYTVGVEVENNGVGEAWREELLQVCDVVFATLLMHLGHGPKFLVGHKEWASRRGKIDPAGIPMNKYRERVADEIRAIKREKGTTTEPGKPRRRPAPASTRIYEVRAGDSLSAIARRHRMSVLDLVELNYPIHPGDTLKVRPKGR